MSRLHLLIDSPIAELRLDNPSKLNAFTRDMLRALESHCDAIERDETIRAVVVTAVGERAFCAGADIKEWAALTPQDFARNWVRSGHRVFDRLTRLSKPTIAALNAHTFGGGLEFAACCDLRVIAPNATLALPEASIGVVPGWSGTQRLIRLIGEPAVKDMALFGRRLSAERAVTLGFAAELADDPRARAFEIATQAAKQSSAATEIAKYMIHAGVGEDRDALIEALGSGMVAATADRAEGVTSFLEKRPAKFGTNPL